MARPTRFESGKVQRISVSLSQEHVDKLARLVTKYNAPSRSALIAKLLDRVPDPKDQT
jgi:metal-responsive CopG/Arc/MetJ family transcriptional regulator